MQIWRGLRKCQVAHSVRLANSKRHNQPRSAFRLLLCSVWTDGRAGSLSVLCTCHHMGMSPLSLGRSRLTGDGGRGPRVEMQGSTSEQCWGQCRWLADLLWLWPSCSCDCAIPKPIQNMQLHPLPSCPHPSSPEGHVGHNTEKPAVMRVGISPLAAALSGAQCRSERSLLRPLISYGNDTLHPCTCCPRCGAACGQPWLRSPPLAWALHLAHVIAATSIISPCQ